MQCPRCKESVFNDNILCPHCGYDLRIIRSIDSIKDELQRVKNDSQALTDKVVGLQKQVEGFELLVSEPQEMFEEEPAGMEEHDHISQPQEPLRNETTQEKATLPETPPPFFGLFENSTRIIDGYHLSEIKVGQKWLLIAGVVTTVLAFGWFLKYSFDQNWVGPAGRIAMAYLGGMAFLGGGEFFRRKNFDIFGLYLIGGGIATLYFSTFAAFQIYHLLPQAPAFFIMILVTALAGALSLVYDTKWLAVLGLIGGFLTPVILSTGHDNQIALMTYMTILNAGILTIAFYKQWQLLNYLGFLFTWTLFTGWYVRYYQDYKFWLAFVYLNIFFLTYDLVPFVYYITKEHKKRLLGIGMIIMNSFIAFGYAFAMIKARYAVEFVSLVTLTYAAILLYMSRFIYSRNREHIESFIMLLAMAMVFLFITIPILFSTKWVTFFWMIQAACILWAALRLQNQWLYRGSAAILLFTIFKLFLYDYEHIFHIHLERLPFFHGFFHLATERLITEASVILSMFLSCRMVTRLRQAMRLIPTYDNDPAFFWTAFSIILFAILHIEVSAFFSTYMPQARFASISVLWTLFSIALIVIGFIKNKAVVRHSAIALFSLTMIKVFFVDMTHITTPWRIISFMALGIMLIGASYLYYRFKDRIVSPDQNEGAAR